MDNVINYAIRFDFRNIPDTQTLEDDSDNDPGLQATKDYINQGISITIALNGNIHIRINTWVLGFISLQFGIDSAILAFIGTFTSSNTTTLFTPTIEQFAFNKQPSWQRYLLLADVFAILGPIFMVIALFTSCFR